MTPYVTIHAAPLSQLLAGIVADIPRYRSDLSEPSKDRPKNMKCRTVAARAIQARILEVIKAGHHVDSPTLVKALDSNRFSIYNNAHTMAEEGLIRMVRLSTRKFYWEAV